MRFTKLGFTIGTAVLATAALAMPTMNGVFKTTYKPAENGAVAKAGCVLCHATKTTFSKFNGYGEDLKKALVDAKTKKMTPEILKKVEDLDSDKDGAKNLEEIKADTLPGDATSCPAKK